jgi:hypothetical protein
MNGRIKIMNFEPGKDGIYKSAGFAKETGMQIWIQIATYAKHRNYELSHTGG